MLDWSMHVTSCIDIRSFSDDIGRKKCRHETVGPDLGGHRQVCGSDTQENSIEVVCKRIQNEEARLPASQLFSAMPPLEAVKVLVSIMMSVSLSNKRKSLKLRHYDISSSAQFQGTAQRLTYIRLPAEDRQKYGEDKVARLIKSMYGTQDASDVWQLDYVNLICGELGGFRRGKPQCSIVPRNPS